MKNLAGSSEATRHAIRELDQAGVPVTSADSVDGETKVEAGGALRAGKHTARLTRQWAYWSVTVSPPLPVDLAVALNDAPGVGGGTTYSGDGATLGSVVRAHGFAGGMSSADVYEWGECSTWHIDTPEGLKAFSEWFKTALGPPTAP